jgi:hypothetical protein
MLPVQVADFLQDASTATAAAAQGSHLIVPASKQYPDAISRHRTPSEDVATLLALGEGLGEVMLHGEGMDGTRLKHALHFLPSTCASLAIAASIQNSHLHISLDAHAVGRISHRIAISHALQAERTRILSLRISDLYDMTLEEGDTWLTLLLSPLEHLERLELEKSCSRVVLPRFTSLSKLTLVGDDGLPDFFTPLLSHLKTLKVRSKAFPFRFCKYLNC